MATKESKHQGEVFKIHLVNSSSMNDIRCQSDTNEEQSHNDSYSKRSKFACNRCRKRKTKCSGQIPCRSCSTLGLGCNYTRKPKKTSILDTEIEGYQMKIQSLEEELKNLKESRQISNISKINPVIPKGTLAPSDKFSLSIWLGSPSCELICWNLNQIIKADPKNMSNTEEIMISPEFDSFIEEKTYDYIINDSRGFSTSENGLLQFTLSSLTINQVNNLFDNVVFFINSGYLIINPIEFRQRVKGYFNAEGRFDTISFQADKVDFFLFKMLIIMTLGEVYSKESRIGKNIPNKFSPVPGLKYFQLIVKYMPSPFSILKLSPSEMNDNIDVIELLGLISLYLRILDKKNASVLFTLNALQLCISLNLHKETNQHSSKYGDFDFNRIWWATYCINRFNSSRIGQPLLLNIDDITADYPQGSNFKNESLPKSKDDYSNNDAMKYYINLAKISDKITTELYCLKTPFDNKVYLGAILKILDSLVDWVQGIPEYLRLNVSNEYNSENERLIYSLHLNYLHNIYLSCIPILLNFAKTKISTFKTNKASISQPLDLDTLPWNIKNLIVTAINASRLTINIFMALYKVGRLSSFGFTDLDYLFSTSLVFVICLILRIDTLGEESYNFRTYLDIAMGLMLEMTIKGNMVAKGKLNQVSTLLCSLNNLFILSGSEALIKDIKKYEFNLGTGTGEFENTEVRPNSSYGKTSINNLLNTLDDATIRKPSSIAGAMDNSENSSGNHSSIYQVDSPALVDYGNNLLLEDFQTGRDISDCTFVVNNDFPYINDKTTTGSPSSLHHDFTRVTDEDILFFEHIMQNFKASP